jgi:hypothetical protein
VVPRSRLNKVIKQRNDYREQVETLTSGTQQDEDDDNDFDDDDDGQRNRGGKAQKKQGQQRSKSVDEATLRQQLEQERDEAIQKVKIQYAGLDKLREVGAVDPEVAYSLLDLSKVKFGADGKLEGFDEQVTALRESKKYLFNAQQQEQPGGRKATPSGTGKDSGNDQFEGVNSVTEFLKLSTSDQIKFKTTYPEKFKSFLNN